MPHVVFSNAWAGACATAINRSAAYREAAKTWEGSLMLVMIPRNGEAELRVWLDLWHGECRAARAGTAADESTTRYILIAQRMVWQQVLEGRLAPLLAIMTGKLKLAKGTLAELLPYVGAAKELVVAASTVPATWPEPT